jgi:tetratricopeptide (TPR) repeat protein
VEYVRRDKDVELDTALTRARSDGPRIVLVAGDSAAGKSRSASEALRRDGVLLGWRLVVPLSDGGLSRLADADLGWQDTVVWLDDLDKYLARLDLGTLRRIVAEDPGVVVVATMRTSQLQARQSQLTDPAWDFLTDDAEVTRVDLDAPLSDDELQTASAQISDPALLDALQKGTGLGEWLVAGPELMTTLRDARGLNRAFADTVISWYRTGLDQPLARNDARRLWADGLSPALRQRLLSRGLDEQGGLFEQASVWACQPVVSRVLYEQALISKAAGGYVAHDYVVDQVMREPAHPAVPDQIWEHALQTAACSSEADQRSGLFWAVGAAAYQERAWAHSLTAMQALAEGEPDDAGAWGNIGMLLRELGRLEEAAGAYDRVVARFGDATEPVLRQVVAWTLVNKGLILGELGRSEEAPAVFDQVVARFGDATEPELREQVATALMNKGITLGQLNRPQAEIEVYDQVVARFGEAAEPGLRRRTAKALVNKGVALGELGRPDAAIEAYDR